MEASDAFSDFAKKAETHGLKQKTIEILIKEDFDNEIALATMRRDDMVALGITRGQTGVLCKWISKLKINDGSDRCTENPENEQPEEEIGACSKNVSAPYNLNEKIADHMKSKGTKGLEELLGGKLDKFMNIGQPECYQIDLNAIDLDVDIGDDTDREVDVEECLRNLNVPDEVRTEMSSHFEKHGVQGLGQLLDHHLQKFLTYTVNIALIGRSGSGKSTFINTLRNLRPHDQGAAKVGAIETTKEPSPYRFPLVNNVILWDLPGANTPSFPLETYLTRVNFAKYDAFIIICTDRVTQDDIWLATEAEASKRPFYFVRTKIDEVVVNARRDGIREQEALTKMRKNIEDELSKASLPTNLVFLVSGVITNQTSWDFPKMAGLLTTDTPCKCSAVLTVAMVSSSHHMITMKKKELWDRIDQISLSASNSKNNCDEVVLNEIKFYAETLGVMDEDFEKWQIDMAKLKPELQRIKDALHHMLRELLGRRIPVMMLGGVEMFLNLIMKAGLFTKKLTNLTNACRVAREDADRKSSEIKRQTAQKTLLLALEHCTLLARGVLEARMEQ